MIRVGLNGFGRIGRAITRIISDRRDMKLVAINDIDDDIENLSYLIKYDSTYGSFKKIQSPQPSSPKIDTHCRKRIIFFILTI